MADVAATATTTEVTAVPAVAVAPKKAVVTKKAAGTKKSAAAKPNHPPTSAMVNAAIVALKDRKGSSLQAIKKYIAATYKVDVEKQSVFIKKYLKSAVTKESIVQTKGSGASGRFKLPIKTEVVKKVKPIVKKPVQKKVAVAKKSLVKKAIAKKPVVKKAVAMKAPVKKPVSVKKPVAKKPVPVSIKPKVTKTVKKTVKVPATKPKAPKPKVVKK